MTAQFEDFSGQTSKGPRGWVGRFRGTELLVVIFRLPSNVVTMTRPGSCPGSWCKPRTNNSWKYCENDLCEIHTNNNSESRHPLHRMNIGEHPFCIPSPRSARTFYYYRESSCLGAMTNSMATRYMTAMPHVARIHPSTLHRSPRNRSHTSWTQSWL